jgi:hypothetical protein
VPYEPPPPTYGQPWPPGWTPTYGAPYPGSRDHKGATTALVLGIVSIVSLLLAMFCCLTLPGVFCAPFAWVAGARAKREIERSPGVYGNFSSAVAGMWIGIVMTALSILVLTAVVALVVWIGYTDWSLV